MTAGNVCARYKMHDRITRGTTPRSRVLALSGDNGARFTGWTRQGELNEKKKGVTVVVRVKIRVFCYLHLLSYLRLWWI
ncbi:hypothetical protein CEXT_808641 [Caerostris extrusa]|uniref:Uncharacterized protein n=1 Tax=Caerostris extrusa TaxID=172846 RepID=A0AAV4M743_CAEEX|nr:hypothetical protein CEXT_808641 [Caerostris extrusa]